MGNTTFLKLFQSIARYIESDLLSLFGKKTKLLVLS